MRLFVLPVGVYARNIYQVPSIHQTISKAIAVRSALCVFAQEKCLLHFAYVALVELNQEGLCVLGLC